MGPSAAPGPFLGASWAALGGSWASLGPPWGRSWLLLGCPGGLLGLSGASFWGSWAALGSQRLLVMKHCKNHGFLHGFCKLWGPPGASWGPPGGPWGRSWLVPLLLACFLPGPWAPRPLQGRSWAPLGPLWVAPGPLLGRPGARPGCPGGLLGALWGLLSGLLGRSGQPKVTFHETL